MNSTDYKSFHETFMQNNHGSSAVHTFFFIFFTVLCSIFCALGKSESGTLQFLYEYIVIILPLIAAVTFLSSYIYVLNLIIFTCVVLKLLNNCSKISIFRTLTSINAYHTNQIHLISILRGLTYLITVCCILAVDFQSFPRYLAKTEKYGYSLMDTGVGLFVLVSGLVHKDLRTHRVTAVIKSNAKFISVLSFLGVVRYISVKQLDYHEHVTEYGVHWNFFFTMAVCKLCSTIILYLSYQPLLYSAIIMIIHELLLHFYLEKWVFGNELRINFVSANREGISSALGYIALYLFAVHVKHILKRKTERYKVLLNLVFWMWLYFVGIFFDASRTLANAGYCTYVAAVLVNIVAILYFLEILFQDNQKHFYFNIPLVLSAVNENGLVYFLAANLMTGAVNLSVRTLLVFNVTAFVILNMYMTINTVLALILKKKPTKI